MRIRATVAKQTWSTKKDSRRVLSRMISSCSFTSIDSFSKVCYLLRKCKNIGVNIIYCTVVCRALQARVSRQVMMNVEENDSGDESKQPERVSLAELKHRGKKKAIAPINRTGAAIRSKRANLQICWKIQVDISSSLAPFFISALLFKEGVLKGT